MRLVDWLEKRFSKYAIPRLINLIAILNAFFYLMSMMHGDQAMMQRYGLERNAVLQGEVWRLVTHVVLFPQMNPLFMLFAIYLLWLYGTALEQDWGSFRFNLFYFTGVLATTIGGLLGGGATSGCVALNTSIFLAFAALWPNFELLLFFLIPVKVKWLAWITFGFYGLTLINGPTTTKLVILASLANYGLFFWRDFYHAMSDRSRREQFQAQMAAERSASFHLCVVCQRTEKDDNRLEFRVCTDCGNEYCMEHLDHHDH